MIIRIIVVKNKYYEYRLKSGKLILSPETWPLGTHLVAIFLTSKAWHLSGRSLSFL